jgi:hypothetical protein
VAGLVGQDGLPAGHQAEHVGRPDRSLGHRVELAQALDLVVEPLHPHRTLGAHREGVHDAAAPGKLAGHTDGLGRFIA